MSISLPVPGPETQIHPSSLSFDELLTPKNYRPFVGLANWPPQTYDALVELLTPKDGVIDRRPGMADAHGVLIEGPCEGGYVSIDFHTMRMAPTQAAPGQYHRRDFHGKWEHYADPVQAPKPKTNYGFYKTVVDFGRSNRGKTWNLLTAIRKSATPVHDIRPGILILARKDYRFSIPEGYHPQDRAWSDGCESSLLVKISDYEIPGNGKLEFRDAFQDSQTSRSRPSSSFEILTCNGDGIYPVQIIKNDRGKVTCVKVRFHSQDMQLPPEPEFQSDQTTNDTWDDAFFALAKKVVALDAVARALGVRASGARSNLGSGGLGGRNASLLGSGRGHATATGVPIDGITPEMLRAFQALGGLN